MVGCHDTKVHCRSQDTCQGWLCKEGLHSPPQACLGTRTKLLPACVRAQLQLLVLQERPHCVLVVACLPG